MCSFRKILLGTLVPTLALAVLVGCGDKKDKAGGGDNGKPDDSSPKVKQALEAKSRGTIKGQVVFVGDMPDFAADTKALQDKIDKNKDKDHCLMGASDEEKSQYEWRIDPETKGVENVFVWLAPPEGYYFQLDNNDKKPADMEKVIDQPHCAFIPHAQVLFPSYFDGQKQVPTGQAVTIKNSAPMSHNSHYKGGGLDKNEIIPSGGKIDKLKFKLDKSPITVTCEIHAWMKAYMRTFDHPFATVTDKMGNFEIKNVPLDVDLQVVAWHEAAGYLEGGASGQKKKLKDGDTIKLEAKKK